MTSGGSVRRRRRRRHTSADNDAPDWPDYGAGEEREKGGRPHKEVQQTRSNASAMMMMMMKMKTTIMRGKRTINF